MPVITLTPAAVQRIKDFLSTTLEPKPTGLYVGVQGGGCSGFSYKMVLVTPKELDEGWTVEDHDGVTVYIDQMSAMYIEGTIIDFVESLEGSGFKFTNPNVKNTCGCGQSFTA